MSGNLDEILARISTLVKAQAPPSVTKAKLVMQVCKVLATAHFDKATRYARELDELEDLLPEPLKKEVRSVRESFQVFSARQKGFVGKMVAEIDGILNKSNATVDEIMATVTQFEDLFASGTLQEQKEFINLWVDHIDIDPTERHGKVHMKRFPAPGGATGNSSVGMVAGARFEPATGSRDET